MNELIHMNLGVKEANEAKGASSNQETNKCNHDMITLVQCKGCETTNSKDSNAK